MDFIKMLCLALVIGSASSQLPALNRAINIYVKDPYAVQFTLPPNWKIRCTQVEENSPAPGQGQKEAAVIRRMRGYLAGLLHQALANNQHYWISPDTRNFTPDDLLFVGDMTLEDFMTMRGLRREEAEDFLFRGNPINDAMLQTMVHIEIYYHATRRGHPNQHHTISFNFDGLQYFH